MKRLKITIDGILRHERISTPQEIANQFRRVWFKMAIRNSDEIIIKIEEV